LLRRPEGARPGRVLHLSLDTRSASVPRPSQFQLVIVRRAVPVPQGTPINRARSRRPLIARTRLRASGNSERLPIGSASPLPCGRFHPNRPGSAAPASIHASALSNPLASGACPWQTEWSRHPRRLEPSADARRRPWRNGPASYKTTVEDRRPTAGPMGPPSLKQPPQRGRSAGRRTLAATPPGRAGCGLRPAVPSGVRWKWDRTPARPACSTILRRSILLCSWSASPKRSSVASPNVPLSSIAAASPGAIPAATPALVGSEAGPECIGIPTSWQQSAELVGPFFTLRVE
jgi:hypothetical protein